MPYPYNGGLDMSLDVSHAFDSIQEGTKEVAEIAHTKTSEFHEKYVSKVVPDCGKYGDAAKFAAEIAPGVAEYNAIREGDWQSFAISAGIDVAALAVGVFTAGTGYGAVKGGSIAAKAGTKAAVREIAEAGAKKAVKELAEEGAEKAVKEVAEAGAEKAAKELAEAGAEKAARELAETGAEKAAKELAEEGAEKAAKEVVEEGAEKAAREVAEAGTEKAAKEVTEAGAEKAAKEVAEEGAEKTAKETAEKAAVRGVKEVGEEMDRSLVPQYIKEVEKITSRDIPPNQMEHLQKALRENKFTKLSPEDTKPYKIEFNNLRDKLITDWEKNNGFKWPVYTEDIYYKGEVVKKAGQRFDVHHLIESCFGGPNEWWNIHPAAFPYEHQLGIHGINSLANLVF